MLLLSRFRIHRCTSRLPRPMGSAYHPHGRAARFFWHDRYPLAIAIILVMFFFKIIHRVAPSNTKCHILMKVSGTLGGQEMLIATRKFQLELLNISTPNKLLYTGVFGLLMVHFSVMADVGMELENSVQICSPSRDSGSIGAPLVRQDPWDSPIHFMAELRDSFGTMGSLL